MKIQKSGVDTYYSQHQHFRLTNLSVPKINLQYIKK